MDRLWLNGVEEEIKKGGRLDVCIREMKKLREEVEAKEGGAEKVSLIGLDASRGRRSSTYRGRRV
jgi:diphosphomevalonate decarboxylase